MKDNDSLNDIIGVAGIIGIIGIISLFAIGFIQHEKNNSANCRKVRIDNVVREFCEITNAEEELENGLQKGN